MPSSSRLISQRGYNGKDGGNLMGEKFDSVHYQTTGGYKKRDLLKSGVSRRMEGIIYDSQNQGKPSMLQQKS